MKHTYSAIMKCGAILRAEKIGGRWLIGGDYDKSGLSYILRSDGVQFQFKGMTLIRI